MEAFETMNSYQIVKIIANIIDCKEHEVCKYILENEFTRGNLVRLVKDIFQFTEKNKRKLYSYEPSPKIRRRH